jgi:hypothetical protein
MQKEKGEWQKGESDVVSVFGVEDHVEKPQSSPQAADMNSEDRNEKRGGRHQGIREPRDESDEDGFRPFPRKPEKSNRTQAIENREDEVKSAGYRPPAELADDRRDSGHKRLIDVFDRHARVEPGIPPMAGPVFLEETGERGARALVGTDVIQELHAEEFVADVRIDGEQGQGKEDRPPVSAERSVHPGSLSFFHLAGTGLEFHYAVRGVFMMCFPRYIE